METAVRGRVMDRPHGRTDAPPCSTVAGRAARQRATTDEYTPNHWATAWFDSQRTASASPLKTTRPGRPPRPRRGWPTGYGIGAELYPVTITSRPRASQMSTRPTRTRGVR